MNGEKRVYVFAGGKSRPPTGGLISLNPLNGKIDFEYPWRSTEFESVNASTPIQVSSHKIFISAAYKTGGSLLEIQNDFSYKVMWKTSNLSCHWMTPICKDGYLYGINGRHSKESTLVCIDVHSGKKMWGQRLLWKESGNEGVEHSFDLGSLLKVDGKVLALSESGYLLWLDLSVDGASILSVKKLFTARQTWCSPVISHGLLYVVQNTVDHSNGDSPRLKCYNMRP